MNERKIKRILLCVMGGLVAAVVLWAVVKPHPEKHESQVTAATKATAAPEPPKAAESSEVVYAPESPESSESPVPSSPSTPQRVFAPGENVVRAILADDATRRSRNPYEAHLDSMPPGGRKMKINYLGGYLAKMFNDSNYLHLQSAREIGIDPVHSLYDAWQAGTRMERLETCREYYLDNLSHSLPYLVPEAHALLKDIGAAFRDSLQSRGGGDYRIKVTSVLRTPKQVHRLRRRNRNATDTSAHMYGTTFDISYSHFICDSARVPRTQEDMKNLLGEVVADMRNRGRCYVKYERKLPCFHITVR